MLLAQLNDAELGELLEKIQLETTPSNYVHNKQGLKREIAKTRKDGYAISFGQRVPGSASISVAIQNYIVPVALTVLGPKDRIRAKTDFLLKEMRLVTDRISRRLKKRGLGN
jgi:DNA-binding IclR family transcriptional regulator